MKWIFHLFFLARGRPRRFYHSETVHMEDIKSDRFVLHAIYGLYEAWIKNFNFACRKGCATCCTQSVTMTTLEGQDIHAFLESQGRLQEIADLPQCHYFPSITTNAYAQLFLEHAEEFDESVAHWDFTPCMFLGKNNCSIYPVRPFNCRSLFSRTPCNETGAAEVFPALVTANTLIMQIIEHIDQPGSWGNMVDVLSLQQNIKGRIENEKGRHLLKTQPVPGFLIPPEDETIVKDLLKSLAALNVEGIQFPIVHN